MVKITIEYEGETEEYTGDFVILKITKTKEGEVATTAVGEAQLKQVAEAEMRSGKESLKRIAKEHYQEVKEVYQAYLEEESEGITC